jgi:hypothetical protein
MILIHKRFLAWNRGDGHEFFMSGDGRGGEPFKKISAFSFKNIRKRLVFLKNFMTLAGG